MLLSPAIRSNCTSYMYVLFTNPQKHVRIVYFEKGLQPLTTPPTTPDGIVQACCWETMTVLLPGYALYWGHVPQTWHALHPVRTMYFNSSLVPRPSTPPVFDRLLYTASDQNWKCGRPGNKATSTATTPFKLSPLDQPKSASYGPG